MKKLKKILTISRLNNDEKGVNFSLQLSGQERVSLVEDLRKEMAKVAHYEYPQRLRRILEIAHR